MANTVFYEFVIACLLAAAPTNLSPYLVKAMTDGVVLTPSAFSITFGVWPYITATHEFVVPRSIPIIASPFFVEKAALVKQFLKIVLIIFFIKRFIIITLN